MQLKNNMQKNGISLADVTGNGTISVNPVINIHKVITTG